MNGRPFQGVRRGYGKLDWDSSPARSGVLGLYKTYSEGSWSHRTCLSVREDAYDEEVYPAFA